MSRKKPSRRCPFPECGVPIGMRQYFCGLHWRHLPFETQKLIKDTWTKDGLHVVAEKLNAPAVAQIQRNLAKRRGDPLRARMRNFSTQRTEDRT